MSRADQGFWSSVKEAIRGSEQDFTEGNLDRAIVLLAIPMVLEMVMESLFGIVDVYFVSKLGSDAVASVGVAESLLAILFPVALGLAIATTATVARRVGEKNIEDAGVAAVQAILVGVVVSILAGVLGAIFAPDMLRLLGAGPDIVATGSRYARILLGGSGTLVMLFIINAVFRGAGDAAIAMRVLWFANIINILIVPPLINGWGPFPKLGLEGAAIGTTIGRSAGIAYQLWALFGGHGRLSLHASQWRVVPAIGIKIVRMSLGGMFQYAIPHISWLALVKILSLFGSTALAGYTIAIRIIIFAILPSWGLSNAAATLVGQNLGAKKPDRAEKSVWRTAYYNASFLGFVALVFIIFARPIIEIFTTDPAVIEIGVDCLRYISYGYPFYAFGMVMVQSFNGAGDTDTPTRVNLFCYLIWEIPLAWFLSTRAGMGPVGVFLAIAIAESTMAVVGMTLFRRGTWKTRQV